MPHVKVAMLFAMALAAVSCATSDPVSPVDLSRSIIVDGQVQVTLTITPETVDQPGVVVATLTYENTGIQPVTLTSSAGCLSFATVYRGSQRVPFPATQYFCTAALTSHVLEPGVPINMFWPLLIGGDEGLLVPSGTYRFVAELNTHRKNLERTFLVR